MSASYPSSYPYVDQRGPGRFYSQLKGYDENTFGFMKFNPPLSSPIYYPYSRKNDPPIKYVFNYDGLLHPSTDKYENLNCNYPNVNNAYTYNQE